MKNCWIDIQKEEQDEILQFWDITGILENAKDKMALALLLESQYKYVDSNSRYYKSNSSLAIDSVGLAIRLFLKMEPLVKITGSLEPCWFSMHLPIPSRPTLKGCPHHDLAVLCEWKDASADALSEKLLRAFPKQIKINYILLKEDSARIGVVL